VDLTYPDEILYQVTRPARYTGGEWNSITKDWDKTPLRIALAYPDLYEIGMSNMALPILYDILNRRPDVLAERVFAPWPDMAAQLRANRIPLSSLESGHPLQDFDVIGFSLGYELTYTNVLNMLDLAQLPVLAGERNDRHPLVIAGGGCVLNPEPMADFIDLFVIGEGEEVLLELLDRLRDGKRRGKTASRKDHLGELATIPGIYVPSLYHVEYHTDGLVKSVTPIAPEAKPTISRRLVTSLPPPVIRPVVPYIEVVHDRGAIEIQRGCSRGCRFCQAGTIYRPVRERPQQEVIEAVGEIIDGCGYNEVSLVSLCTNDYPGIDRLIDELARRYRNLTISLPSLRIDRSSVNLVDSLPTRRKTGLTFAPEAGSQRLQRVINKVTPEEVLLETAAAAFDRGWTNLKLYFMLGLPTETSDDINDIVRLVEKVRTLDAGINRRQPQIRISLSTFVPKPHTPFQWTAQDSEAQLTAKHEILKAGLKRKRVKPSWPDPRLSLLEAVMSRGDRRLGRVIYHAWKLGSTFDAWGECFRYENWLRAFTDTGLEPSFYAHRQRSLDEVLPWGHIDSGVTTDFLEQEYHRATGGELTNDCRRADCNVCGVQRWHKDCQNKQARS
jgi:radical SAM family uncharacterized protein